MNCYFYQVKHVEQRVKKVIFFFKLYGYQWVIISCLQQVLEGIACVCRGSWDWDSGTEAGSWVEMRKRCCQIKARTDAKQVSFKRTHRT